MVNSEKRDDDQVINPEPMSDNEPTSRKALISSIEPFLNMDFAMVRASLIDEATITHHRTLILEQLGQADAPDFMGKLVNVLAETKAEIEYLKTAYIESLRYDEPDFNIKTPKLPRKIMPDVFELDMRGEITGGNWHYPEPDGRWAGPESYSSILVPALNPGDYDLEIHVIGEAEPGIIDGMQVMINRKEVQIERDGDAIPAVLKSKVMVEDSYRFPFWTLQLRFSKVVSPAKFGSSDERILAIKVQSIRFTKVVDV